MPIRNLAERIGIPEWMTIGIEVVAVAIAGSFWAANLNSRIDAVQSRCDQLAVSTAEIKSQRLEKEKTDILFQQATIRDLSELKAKVDILLGGIRPK